MDNRTWEERILRQEEPYHFQRDRQIDNAQPRPSQPNTFQPNQAPMLMGWGMSTQQYYNTVFENYLNRKKSPSTGLALGRL